MKIGIFDSGIGGLSVANSIYKKHPELDICYVSDSKYLPYGTQDHAIIKERVQKIINFLIESNCDHIICACNTAFAVAEEELNHLSQTQSILNVTEKFIEEYRHRIPRRTALVATKNTIESKIYQRLLQDSEQAIDLRMIIDESLVPLIEASASEDRIRQEIDRLLSSKAHDLEALILGCTHYNDFADIFREYQPNISVFSSEDVFDDCFFSNDSEHQGSMKFYDTGNSELLKNRVLKLYNQIPETIDLVLQD